MKRLQASRCCPLSPLSFVSCCDPSCAPVSSHFMKCNWSLRVAKEHLPPDTSPCSALHVCSHVDASLMRDDPHCCTRALKAEARMLCPVKALRAGAVKRRPSAVVKRYGFLFCFCPSASDIAEVELSLRSATSPHSPSELFKKAKIWARTQVGVFQGSNEPTTISVLRELLWKIDHVGKMRTHPTSIYPWQARCRGTCLLRLLKTCDWMEKLSNGESMETALCSRTHFNDLQ